jgi:hypothetical protein
VENYLSKHSFARAVPKSIEMEFHTFTLLLFLSYLVLSEGFVGHHNERRKVIFFRPAKDSQIVDEEAEYLLRKARELRKEVQEFERSKQTEENLKLEAKEAIQQEQQKLRNRYSAEVPILKPDGSVIMERCDFPPRMKGKDTVNKDISRIITVQANLPIGIVLSQDESLPGITVVDEVAEDSNGMQAGIKVGDILRACTACQVSMDMPTWQLMAGGIGRPKTTRMMFSLDGKPLEEVMNALASNNMDPQKRPSWLVLERLDKKE